MSHQYPPNSRYARAPVLVWTAPDGSQTTYLGRRIIPETRRYTALDHYRSAGDVRIDRLADEYYGDPEQYWRICDANAVENPAEAVAEDGTLVVIPLPLEVSGG
jgi:hypothetical protein